MDRLTVEKRSWNMSRIRGKNTKPELKVRSVLHKLGYRFRLTHQSLPGKPDIILPRYQTVIFVHGCFWHRHKNCKYAYTPKSKIEFWNKKFESNVKRDREIQRQIKALGWHQVIIWECELKDAHTLERKIRKFLA